MKLVVKTKDGREGILHGYGPGKKGRPMGMILIDQRIYAYKLNAFEVIGYARLKPYIETMPFTEDDLRAWDATGVNPS